MKDRPTVDRLAEFSIAAAAIASPAIALHAHRAIAPIFAAAAIAAIAPDLARRRLPPLDPTLLVLFLATAAWSAASLLWSIDGGSGVGPILRLALTLMGALAFAGVARRLSPAAAATAGTALLAGMTIGAILLIVEAATGGAIKSLVSDREAPIVAIKAGSTVLVVLAWPAIAIAVVRGRAALGWLLGAAIAIPLAFMDGRAAILALGAGAIVYFSGWIAPRATAAAIALGSGLAVLAGPPIARDLLPRLLGGIEDGVLPFTGAHRIEIWRFAAEHIFERPLAGWGFDAARVFPGGDRILDPATHAMQMPLHPHNVGLQWWLELGLVGAAIGILVIAAIARAAARLPTPARRAGALATLAAALLIGMLSYGAWQSWWLAVLALSGTFAALGSAPADRTRHTHS